MEDRDIRRILKIEIELLTDDKYTAHWRWNEFYVGKSDWSVFKRFHDAKELYKNVRREGYRSYARYLLSLLGISPD